MFFLNCDPFTGRRNKEQRAQNKHKVDIVFESLFEPLFPVLIMMWLFMCWMYDRIVGYIDTKHKEDDHLQKLKYFNLHWHFQKCYNHKSCVKISERQKYGNWPAFPASCPPLQTTFGLTLDFVTWKMYQGPSTNIDNLHSEPNCFENVWNFKDIWLWINDIHNTKGKENHEIFERPY